ncbi:MAG TPA: YbjQ family protein [Virgibacillus sp.]|nr:YbjQ family protein [Virgibacillus sp.]
MLIVTTDDVPGKGVTEVKGLVQGSTVEAKNIGHDIGAGIKNLIGGEIDDYSGLMKKARHIAVKRMIREAEERGANAIVGMRYQTSEIMSMASEVIAYGTAVVLE